MDLDFVKKRITELRMQKGVSEYKMSLDLGRSKGYVQGISSGRALPSVSEFFAICEYFGITPQEFFDESAAHPIHLEALSSLARQLSSEDLELLCQIAERLKRNHDKT